MSQTGQQAPDIGVGDAEPAAETPRMQVDAGLWRLPPEEAATRDERTVDEPGDGLRPDGLQQRALGAGAYSPVSLRFYDAGVLGFSSRMIWRCPSDRILDLYQANVTANHLDVGVGTGYFLDRLQFPSPTPRLGLLDLNGNSLTHTARRLIRYGPELYRADVLKPIPIQADPFDSVGLNYLLHCLPGPMEAKAVAFDNLLPFLRPGGVVFGSTVLRHGIRLPPQARVWMGLYNVLGAFGNSKDSLDGLQRALDERFAEHAVRVYGCVALFWGRVAPEIAPGLPPSVAPERPSA